MAPIGMLFKSKNFGSNGPIHRRYDPYLSAAKQVASTVGEGALAVHLVHQALVESKDSSYNKLPHEHQGWKEYCVTAITWQPPVGQNA
jgi:hypothetical protein